MTNFKDTILVSATKYLVPLLLGMVVAGFGWYNTVNKDNSDFIRNDIKHEKRLDFYEVKFTKQDEINQQLLTSLAVLTESLKIQMENTKEQIKELKRK